MEANANGAPESPSPNPDPQPETTSEIPSDPLLMSGAFIDISADITQMETQAETQTEQPSAIQEGKALVECIRRRGRRKAETVDLSNVFKEPVDWLPEGWKVEYRMRNSGASAGQVDKYYIEPVSGLQFRSKKEVEYFMETGKKRKTPGKQSTENADDVICLGSSNSQKQQKPKSGGKKSMPNFNLDDVPEKVTWVLTGPEPDATRSAWTPYINGEPVPESVRQEWDATFDYHMGRNSDSRS